MLSSFVVRSSSAHAAEQACSLPTLRQGGLMSARNSATVMLGIVELSVSPQWSHVICSQRSIMRNVYSRRPDKINTGSCDCQRVAAHVRAQVLP